MTPDIARELFVVGLKNAHAMEIQARELLERQIERSDDYPSVQEQLRNHLEQTKRQLERLDECLSACGERPSGIKDTTLSVGANLAAMAHATASDEILKNTFANEAFEHYEIAAYTSLLVLCDKANVIDASDYLRQSLAEEEAMAEWVHAHVETITLEYLSKAERERGSA